MISEWFLLGVVVDEAGWRPSLEDAPLMGGKSLVRKILEERCLLVCGVEEVKRVDSVLGGGIGGRGGLISVIEGVELAEYSGSSDLGICGDIERLDSLRGALERRLGIGNVTASISEVCDGEDLARGVCD